MRILLIEDDHATAQSINFMLRSEGNSVQITDRGDEGLGLATSYSYDMILLDLNLPDMSGYEVLRTLRQQGTKTAVIIVSGLAGVEDKVRGLGFGADDYITKPFHKDELVARIHAVVRRVKGYAQSIVTVGKLAVNLSTRNATVGTTRLQLTGKEYGVLECMALRLGAVISKEDFLNHLYGTEGRAEAKIIDVFVCKLRKKIQNVDGQDYIETLWGKGYVLRDPAAAAVAA